MVNYRSIDDFLSELYVYKHRAYYGSRKRRLLRSCCEIPLPLLALCIANSSDATEVLMLSYLLADSRFREDMFSEDSSSSMEGAEYLASSIFVGMLIGGTVLGFLSDRIGRRPALLLGLLTNSVAGMCSSLPIFAPSFVSLTMWRFVAGVGIGATVPPLFTLASEWSSKEVRGVFVTAVASFWMVGSIFVSSLAWCLFQLDPMHELPIWRVFAATCALPSLLGAWMVYNYVPESPRFYLAAEKCDYELAAKSCNQMAMLLNVHLDHEKESTLLGAAFDHRALENVYFNSFLFALSSLPGNIVSMVYSDRYGRKKMLIGSLIGAASGLVVFATTVYAGSRQENDGQSNTSMQTFVIVLCACAFQAFGTISWNTIDIITAEMFPTNVRSAGMGVCTATGRLGGILSQCINAKLIVDDRDMTMEELRDDAIEDSTDCCCSRKRKDHLSDEETDMPQLQLQSSRSLEYQSFQQEVESNQPFLL
ncbi:MFS transporter [Skeletonema marinoi]|uniref:MFS transporter n=1 Tax=Skeletonema marinoi TaxID=267567 RepID=A0AAD8YEK1_9STRA|nr:MFS transporter [Skeletonema marinoi]